MKNDLKNLFTQKSKVFKHNLTLFPNQWISFIPPFMQQIFIEPLLHTKDCTTQKMKCW